MGTSKRNRKREQSEMPASAIAGATRRPETNCCGAIEPQRPSQQRPSDNLYWRRNLLRLLLAVCALMASGRVALSDQPQEIKIGYLRQAPSKIRISLIDVQSSPD